MDRLGQILTTAYLTFFFTGFVRPLSGTVASVVSLPFILSLDSLLPAEQGARLLLLGLLTAFLSGLTVVAIWHSRRVPIEHCDQPSIVMDEVCGMIVASVPLLLLSPYTWQMALLTLVLFRFFDIVKPLGIGRIDRMNTPLSVVLDDLVAGLYTAVITGGFLLV